METKDYYKILGVKDTAQPDQIKSAYRHLAFEYHPDRNSGSPDAAEKMKLINEAYAVLSNPVKRREYDRIRKQFGSSAYSQFRKNYSEQDIFSGSDIFTVFEEMARSFGFRNPDEIFKEFYGQGYRQFEFKQPGFFFKGFVFTGGFGRPQTSRPKLPGLGNLGRLSRFVFKKISGIDVPENGADITDLVQLTPQQALEGGPYAYFLRQKAKKLVIQIPKGIRHGQRIRLAGQGQEGKDGGRPGDLYLKVNIRKPLLEKLKDFTKELIKR